MKEIKSKQLRYYCSSIGEIHERGKRMLDNADELPPPLQRPYQELWTDEWNLCCYIVFLDRQPGILLCAEYDADYCRRRGIPIEYDAQYAVLFSCGERLEKLAREINPHVTVGLSYDNAVDPQIMLFIPTENVSYQDTLKLYYLMDQYGFQRAPDHVRWCVQELAEFAKQLRLTPEIERKMLTGLDRDVELGTAAGRADYTPQYMGMEIEQSKLYSMDELLNMLSRYGDSDSTLDKVRSTYTERLGNQLIWEYPFSESTQGGGAIIPVREGFLFLPYSSVFEHGGARYQLSGAGLLSAEDIHTLQKECNAYMERMLDALGDMDHAMWTYPIKRYEDDQGNLYFVRAGLGGVYKGFRRYAEPKPGQRRESGIRSLSYVKDFSRAQLDLDQYAKKHGLKEVKSRKVKQECEQDG